MVRFLGYPNLDFKFSSSHQFTNRSLLIFVIKVINQAIAVSWKIANDKASKLGIKSPMIYNCVSGNTNPITIQQICQYSRDAGRKNPSGSILWFTNDLLTFL